MMVLQVLETCKSNTHLWAGKQWTTTRPGIHCAGQYHLSVTYFTASDATIFIHPTQHHVGPTSKYLNTIHWINIRSYHTMKLTFMRYIIANGPSCSRILLLPCASFSISLTFPFLSLFFWGGIWERERDVLKAAINTFLSTKTYKEFLPKIHLLNEIKSILLSNTASISSSHL